MPRVARERSETGVYHVMVRGINRQDIFLDDEDRIRYLESLDKVRARSNCTIYAYCLMDNHVHLVISEGDEEIGQVMKRLGSSYVLWYNQKYARVGHLFQDRFHSEAINNETYLLTAVRYVHQNPINAGISSDCSGHQWSSYNSYLGGTEIIPNLTSIAEVLGAIGDIKQFISFHLDADGDETLLDVEKVDKAADTIAAQQIRTLLEGVSVTELMAMNEADRNGVLRQLKALPGVSQRQIARLTGLNRNMIQRA